MSMFLCAKCDDLHDSDLGCEEAPSPPYKPHGLLCLDCAHEEPAPRGEFSPAQQAIIDAHMNDEDGDAIGKAADTPASAKLQSDVASKESPDAGL